VTLWNWCGSACDSTATAFVSVANPLVETTRFFHQPGVPIKNGLTLMCFFQSFYVQLVSKCILKMLQIS